MIAIRLFIFLLSYTTVLVLVNACYVSITDNGPVVSGASITFWANPYNDDIPPNTAYIFDWKDDAIPRHTYEFSGTNSTWTVPFPKAEYVPGTYEVEVDVYREIAFFKFSICSDRKFFNITPYLNGHIELKQSNSTVKKYVSTEVPVLQEISLNDADLEFVKKNSSSILTYWFVNCVYQAKTPNLSFSRNYTNASQVYNLEAVVVISHEPLPPTPTPPSNTTTTATTTTTPTTTANNYTTQAGGTFPATQKHKKSLTESTVQFSAHLSTDSTEPYDNGTISNDIVNLDGHSELVYSLSPNNNETVSHIDQAMPPSCGSKVTAPDPKKTVGYFSRKIIAKEPVRNITVEGNAWLQHGQLLNLEVSCNGTGPFNYCTIFKNSVYNITGNESCVIDFNIPSCEISVRRYLSQPTTYTMVLIIHNDVNKVITPIGINIYEVTKHAQLSVIIVPISAGIVAIISIIFGVAYYIQSKRRYTIEVADFDFSHASDLEYKTFYERLLESVSNAFNKEEEYSEQDSICAGPASRKYGNMQ